MRKPFVSALTAAIVAITAGPVAAAERQWPRVTNRGPWLAFIAVVGVVAIAIALVTIWGGGVGPEPTLGPPDDDEHHGRTDH